MPCAREGGALSPSRQGSKPERPGRLRRPDSREPDPPQAEAPYRRAKWKEDPVCKQVENISQDAENGPDAVNGR